MGKVREPGFRFRNADPAEQFRGPVPRLLAAHSQMGAQRLAELVAHGEDGIEGRHRILEDETNLPAADPPKRLRIELKQIPSLEDRLTGQDLGGRRGQQPHHGQHGRTLAGAAFAHQPEELPLPDLEADAVHRMNIARIGAKPHDEVADLKHRCPGAVPRSSEWPLPEFEPRPAGGSSRAAGANRCTCPFRAGRKNGSRTSHRERTAWRTPRPPAYPSSPTR